MPKAAWVRACSGSAAVGVIALFTCAAGAAALRVIDSPYYVVHTDLDGDDAREAVVRMTRMYEEYRFRTRGFAGEVQGRLPFYLYRTKQAYLEAGGPKGTAGVFSEGVLMATAGGEVSPQTWGVVQHEGFHQFAAAVIRANLPTWLNEGLAEYFAQAQFTGDSFVDALIPPERLARLVGAMKAGRLKPLKDLMAMSRDQWNGRMATENYDQSWSLVHFLVHGQDGKYQAGFAQFVSRLGSGSNAGGAWKQANLPAAPALEADWRRWWLAQPPDPTADLYARARAETFASYLARAAGQRQRFKTFEEFVAAARAGAVRTGPARWSGTAADDWLPPRLLGESAQEAVATKVRWSLVQVASDKSRIIADCPDGVRLTTTCVVKAGQRPQIDTDTDDVALVVQRARTLVRDGKREEARTVLVNALKAHPNSPSATEARQVLAQAK